MRSALACVNVFVEGELLNRRWKLPYSRTDATYYPFPVHSRPPAALHMKPSAAQRNGEEGTLDKALEETVKVVDVGGRHWRWCGCCE